MMRSAFYISHALSLIFLTTTVIFGADSSFPPPEKNDTIKIGLLISDNRSTSALHGAEMVIRETNEKGGINGHPVALIFRSMEGPWGTGSKQAVDLIFKEKVWAILGSHDGRNAHLAEQVTAKTRVVFLSAWAGDPTLSQAFVPWYFSCVPNSNQQAEALIHEIYDKRNLKEITVISDSSYDSEKGMKSFVNKITATKKPTPVLFRYSNPTNTGIKLKKANNDCIVIFANSYSTIKIISELKNADYTAPVFCSLSLMGEKELTGIDLKTAEGVIFISSGHCFNSKGITFRNSFQNLYGYLPGPVAAYAYDGMSVLVEAIKKAEPDRDTTQKNVMSLQYKGVTGTITFDERGNRTGPVNLMVIKNGVPVKIE